MKKTYKLPYGISNFARLVRDGYYFVDRTNYIEQLEKLGEPYLFFLRPRRFGKTLLLSVLEHYYAKAHKGEFEQLFGGYYIGTNPTPSANKYLVLKFDFSGVNTKTQESTFRGVLENVKEGARNLFDEYPSIFDDMDLQTIESESAPNLALQKIFSIVRSKRIPEKLFVLIDEYDHFTNEMLAFRLTEFKEIVSRNGFVRKFFEILKQGTGSGLVDRIFITGVSPVTLDSLTSGFNIGKSISRNPMFAEMTGFTDDEVISLLKIMPAAATLPPESLMPELRNWYNGYRFTNQRQQTIYNPGMVLYFCTELQNTGTFPEKMLDNNLSSDYGKLRRMFEIESPSQNYEILREIVETRQTTGTIIQQYSFEIPFSRDHFVSLLYYLGLLTVESSWANISTFRIPNFAVERLFYDYFLHLLQKREKLSVQQQTLQTAMRTMALDNNPRPFFEYVEVFLQHLSNRDYREFSEKHLKVIIFTLALQTNIYFVKSERETTGGYIDLLFLAQSPTPVSSQYIFELKYLKKGEAAQLTSAREIAKNQLLEYVDNDAELSGFSDLQGWTVVVVKDELHLEKVYPLAQA